MIQMEIYAPDGHLITTHVHDGGICTIGRARRADITLPHRSISRRHAEVSCSEHSVTIRDLGSRSGVWLDGERIRHSGPLADGDVVQLGDCRLRIAFGQRHSATPSLAAASAGPPTEAGPSVPAAPVREAPVHPLPESLDTLHTEAMVSLCRTFQKQIAKTLNLYRRNIIDELSGERLRQEARRAAEQVLAEGLVEVPAGTDREQLLETVVAETVGLGPLEPLMADDAVTEIMVNGPECIYVERNGRLQRTPRRFTTPASLMSVVDRIVTPLGRRIDEGSPLVDARLPDGSRVNAIIPPLSLVGPVLTIRKFARRKFGLDELERIDALDRNISDFLKVCIRFRKNIIISGGTGTGKTTFLNALSEYIPDGERIVTIEDSAEIRLHQEHVVSLESRPANIEGSGEVGIRDLVRNALRMRPDRIIVGECRGGEALDMLQAMNTGHDGSLTTAHANAPRDALSRLEVMTLMAGMDLPVRAIREQIASAVDIIVQLSRFPDGRRRVTSVTEVDGMEGDSVLTQELFRFQQTGIDADGVVHGRFECVGNVPRFYQQLRSGGVELDLSIFQRTAS